MRTDRKQTELELTRDVQIHYYCRFQSPDVLFEGIVVDSIAAERPRFDCGSRARGNSAWSIAASLGSVEYGVAVVGDGAIVAVVLCSATGPMSVVREE